MPVISRFYGVLIKMYFKEHGIAHFHAIYGEFNQSYCACGRNRSLSKFVLTAWDMELYGMMILTLANPSHGLMGGLNKI